MKKRLHAIALLCLLIIVKSTGQPIRYSNNKLNISEYKYKIIGEVNNNIIVCSTSIVKQRAAAILVYDRSMNLINTINTNITQAEPGSVHFFRYGNSVQVLHPYRTKDGFLVKLASLMIKAIC